MEGTTLYMEAFWYAECRTCGRAITTAPNDVDTCLFKVSTHLRAFHKNPDVAADVVITGTLKTRKQGQLPSRPDSLPDPIAALDAAVSRVEGGE